MRLVEFLIHVLSAQAETLRRLSALFGEEALFEILENAGDSPVQAPLPPVRKESLETDSTPEIGSPYALLENSVREFQLPEFLEFHLWAYPYYRLMIEEDLNLNARIPGAGGQIGSVWVEDAVAYAEAWIKNLPLPPQSGPQAERAAHVPWLRFRTETLKRIGKRPMRPVY